MESLNNYKQKKRQRIEAEEFVEQEGHEGRMSSDSFHLSPEHCVLKLQRAGQYTTGGQNYWDSPDAFSKSLIDYIVRNREIIFESVLIAMRTEEKEALINCGDDLKAALSEVEAAKAAIA